jgi:hypothetical protein
MFVLDRFQAIVGSFILLRRDPLPSNTLARYVLCMMGIMCLRCPSFAQYSDNDAPPVYHHSTTFSHRTFSVRMLALPPSLSLHMNVSALFDASSPCRRFLNGVSLVSEIPHCLTPKWRDLNRESRMRYILRCDRGVYIVRPIYRASSVTMARRCST